MGRTGKESHRWKGGRGITPLGYVWVYAPGHPRADKHGSHVYEHILVAEKALGKPLPPGAIVHHVNEDRADNRPENLVICQNDAYHKLIHIRLRALKACGHAAWKQCYFCKVWSDPADPKSNMFVDKKGTAHHRACLNARPRKSRRKINELSIKTEGRKYHDGNFQVW